MDLAFDDIEKFFLTLKVTLSIAFLKCTIFFENNNFYFAKKGKRKNKRQRRTKFF